MQAVDKILVINNSIVVAGQSKGGIALTAWLGQLLFMMML